MVCRSKNRRIEAELVRLSRNDLEALASRVVRAYMKLPELQGQAIYCIDPELLCSSLLHLKVDYQHLSKQGIILGLTAFEPVNIVLPDGDYMLDGKTVLIESSLNDEGSCVGRKNFTVVHEGSHQILKMVFPNDYGSKPHEARTAKVHFCKAETPHRGRITDWEEWQTNMLTSAVFLPKELIDKAMQRVSLRGRIERLNSVFYREEFEKFLEMSKILGCSMQALSIRMKQFGLIGEDYLGEPYRLLDVEVD